MEQLSYLEQLKQQLNRLSCDNVNELSKLAAVNTDTYRKLLTGLYSHIMEEAQSSNLEKHYLIEIRKLWQLHIVHLDFVRFFYDHSNYKKLDRPMEFNDMDLPAWIELRGCVAPNDNPFIQLDERQKIYWQYLGFAQKLETVMMAIDQELSKKLGFIPNFEMICDPQSGESDLVFKIKGDYMLDLVPKENPERIRELNEAKAYIYEKLNDVYQDTKREYYDWLVLSILSFPFPEVIIPDVGQDKPTFVVSWQGTKENLYRKVKCIKEKISSDKKGIIDHLAGIFYDSTKNFGDRRTLKISIFKNNI